MEKSEKKSAKTSSKKSAVKKTAAKKTAIKKTAAKKAATKKTAAKKTSAVKTQADPTIAVLKKCHKVLDDKKAEDLKVLDVRGKSPITNYFIIASATSAPHLKALAGELEKTLKELGIQSVGRDFNTSSGWVVVDAFDFMAHIFLPEQRGLYGIESLWKDAEEINF